MLHSTRVLLALKLLIGETEASLNIYGRYHDRGWLISLYNLRLSDPYVPHTIDIKTPKQNRSNKLKVTKHFILHCIMIDIHSNPHSHSTGRLLTKY